MKKPVTRDPICGMSMNEAFAIQAVRDGKTYYFCGEGCRNSFLAASAANEKKKETTSH